MWMPSSSKHICSNSDLKVLADTTGVRGENPAELCWRQEKEQDNPLIWPCRDQNTRLPQWFVYFPISLPVLLLIWSVAVAWLFPTPDSWSSTLLLVCICWEVCRVKHQRLRGKIISSTHLLFYYHKNALFWSICSCFWLKGSIPAWGDYQETYPLVAGFFKSGSPFLADLGNLKRWVKYNYQKALHACLLPSLLVWQTQQNAQPALGHLPSTKMHQYFTSIYPWLVALKTPSAGMLELKLKSGPLLNSRSVLLLTHCFFEKKAVCISARKR